MADVYTIHTMTKKAAENSLYKIPITEFKDEEDAAATATAIAWTLKDEDGEVVNSRENVDEGSGTSVDIYLEGADLALPDPDYPKRTVDVDFTYTNASGEHTGRIRVEFFIDNSR